VKLSQAVKCELDCLPVTQLKDEQAALSTVSSVSLPCHVIPTNMYVSISSQQESWELSSRQDEQTGLVTDSDCCGCDLLGGVNVKQEPPSPADSNSACHRLSPADSTACHSDTVCVTSSAHGDYQLSSSDGELASSIASVCSPTRETELTVGADEVMPADLKHCDNSAAAAAAAAADVDDDVNTMMSQSLIASSDTSHSPVASLTVSSPVCSSASVARSTSASVQQELVRCRDSSGKTYYIPRGLLLRVRSPSEVNCTKSQTDCSLPSAYRTPRSTTITAVTLSNTTVSSGKGDSLAFVRDVIVKTADCHAVEQQPCVTTVACSLSDCVTNAATLCHAVTTAALTTTTLPLSAQGMLALSCSSHASVLNNAAMTSRNADKVCLTTVKARMASTPYSVVNNAVIKPRILVPLSIANSPARSLPHINVLPSVSPAMRSTNRNMMPANSIMTARTSTSSSPPMYLVVEGNNRVTTGNSRAVKEVVIVPGTKNSTVKGIRMSGVQASAAAGMNGKCASMLSAGLSRCDGETTSVSCSSVSLLPQSAVCVASLNRNSKPAQTSRSAGQISLLRPQHVALSPVITKPASSEPKIQTKRTSSSVSNVIATKIGNQTVIVDVGGLSCSSLPAVKPSVITVTSVCSAKPRDVLVSKPACSQQEVTSQCGNVWQSFEPCVPDTHNPSTVATDDTSENYTPVIR